MLPRRLAVFGCSFSDYTKVKHVYGEYCANALDFSYVHYARGGSSNERMFYAATKSIEDKILVPGDVIVMQYTDPNRKLLSAFEPFEKGGLPGQIEEWVTPYGNAYTSDYKVDSYTWVDKNIKNAHKVLQDLSINDEFEKDQLATWHIMFEALCQVKEITFIPMIGRLCNFNLEERFSDKIKRVTFYELHHLTQGTEANPSPHEIGMACHTGEYDSCHLSKDGHKRLGNKLANHIKKFI